MRRYAFLAPTAALAIMCGQVGWADTVHFPKGSLIIPMQSTFQPQGGVLSAYGLVYRILQANAPGHLNASHPVTVYIVNNASKGSPDRCQPTNFSNRVTGITNPTTNPRGTWNDGCDFTITNDYEQPVVPVDYSVPFPASGFYPDIAVPVYTGDTRAWPRYSWTGITLQRTVTATAATATDFSSVSYLGGPFVIMAADAQNVINLIRNGDSGTATAITAKAAIDIFSNGQKSLSTHCVPTSIDNNTNNAMSAGYPTGCHYVMMHQATHDFDANVVKRFNEPPPPFALYYPAAAGIGGNVLDNYLTAAGLSVWNSGNGTDARGCPTGDIDGCTANGSTCTAGTECTGAKHGNIYDYIDDADMRYQNASTYPNGLINQTQSGDPVYRLFWAPHWDVSSSDAPSIQNLVAYETTPGTAIMTECASITSYENGKNGVGGVAAGSNFLFTNGIYVASTVSGFNCTDPEWPSTNSGHCASFPNPGNILAQLGDWGYTSVGGSNPGYSPASSSSRQAWNQVLITTSNGQDAFDMGQADANHATVLYVAGHDVSGNVDGARVVLNSMLNLSANPIPSERDLAAPVIAYSRSDSDTHYPDTLMTATYQAISGYSTNPAVETLNDPASAQLWTFPYFPGDLRAHDLTSMSPGESDYNAASSWDATHISTAPDGMSPAPGGRNLFTFLGGYPKAIAGATNGVLQVGWQPEAIDGSLLSDSCTELGTVLTGCVDTLGYSSLVTGSSVKYDDGETSSGVHLVVGSDGFCDLQEMANYSDLNTGNDWTGGDCEANNVRKFLTDAPTVAYMFQRVRGYCAPQDLLSGTSLTMDLTKLKPTDSACLSRASSNITNDNRAHLGGLAHSTPAVVGPSLNILDGPVQRPTVAYVGGLDGELHAFYVGGGSGYQRPTDSQAGSTLHFDSNSDSLASDNNKFYTDWHGGTTAFTPPAVGTELWAYMPASQLPLLFNNAAQVDSSPVVMDIFADLSESGLREWHTALVESVGPEGKELFAMDVTNPLRPHLLWDIAGSLMQTGGAPYYSPNMLLNDSYSVPSGTPGSTASCTNPSVNSPIPGTCSIPKWEEGTAKYQPFPLTDPGRVDTKAYDYQDLGGASALALAEIRIGLEPYYVVYAATNMPQGRNGMEVFAIDVATGQKLWQWEDEYGVTIDGVPPPPASNAVPPQPSVIYGPNGAQDILVGDQAGRLWELDALTGENVTDVANCHGASACYAPLFDDGSTAANNQPISTNIAIAKVPPTVASGMALHNCGGATVALFGTAGEDWISNADSTAGEVHVVVVDSGGNPACPVGSEPGGFHDIFANGERVYGNITVAGSVAYVATAKGSIGGDLMTVSGDTSGSTYAIDLGTALPGVQINPSPLEGSGTLATFGGLAVYAPTSGAVPTGLIGAEVSKISYVGKSNLASLPDAKMDSSLNQAKSTWTIQLRNWIERILQ